MALEPVDVRHISFSVARRGYRIEEVDAFLDRSETELAAAIEHGSACLSAADCRAVTFSTARRGYDVDEVDAFLELLAAELASILGDQPLATPPAAVGKPQLAAPLDQPKRRWWQRRTPEELAELRRRGLR